VGKRAPSAIHLGDTVDEPILITNQFVEVLPMRDDQLVAAGR